MRFSTIFLFFSLLLMIVCSLIILSLNSISVEVDLLFLTIQENLGRVILFSFLIGIGVALVSEALYFLNKKSGRKISE
tara:strand:+ start:131 stop:364 length:234 start_codon:yes stop_codon:yes gene_type:complete